jgi:hypothetical protein
MTKNGSPTDQGKFPSKDLFGDALLGLNVSAGSKSTKSSKNDKMLAYFDSLSDKQRSEILRNLRANKEEKEFIQNEIKSETVEVTQEEIQKAELYDNIMKEQRKQKLMLKYGSGAIPSHSLASGLQITLSSRDEQDLCKTKIIIGKEERGSDAITCKKTRDKIVKLLEPKLSAGNLSRLLTSTDITEYDVAAEALSWQSTLKNICKF